MKKRDWNKEVISLIAFWLSLPFSFLAAAGVMVSILYVLMLPFAGSWDGHTTYPSLKAVLFAGIIGATIQLSKEISAFVAKKIASRQGPISK